MLLFTGSSGSSAELKTTGKSNLNISMVEKLLSKAIDRGHVSVPQLISFSRFVINTRS